MISTSKKKEPNRHHQKLYGPQFFDASVDSEKHFQCSPTQRIHNQLATRKILKKYGLYQKDLKYFKVKRRILQRLGHVPEDKEQFTDKDIQLLNSAEGDLLVENALELWERIQLEQARGKG